MRPGFSSQLARPRRSCCYLLFLSLFVGNKIRAGIYLLYPSVLDDIKLKLTSIEREVFPRIAADAGLFAMVLLGFWTPCACTWTTSRTPACACTWTPCSRRTTSRTPVRHGTRETTFTGMCLYLDSMRKEVPHKLASGRTSWATCWCTRPWSSGRAPSSGMPMWLQSSPCLRRCRRKPKRSGETKRWAARPFFGIGGEAAWLGGRSSVAWQRPMGRRR
jgi:hypothetical protein